MTTNTKVTELPNTISINNITLYNEKDQGITYLTDREPSILFPHLANDHRISYTYMKIKDEDNKTVVGIQKGNELLGEGTVDGMEFTGSHVDLIASKEDFLKSNDNFSMISSVLGYLVSAGLAIGGIFMFKKS